MKTFPNIGTKAKPTVVSCDVPYVQLELRVAVVVVVGSTKWRKRPAGVKDIVSSARTADPFSTLRCERMRDTRATSEDLVSCREIHTANVFLCFKPDPQAHLCGCRVDEWECSPLTV